MAKGLAKLFKYGFGALDNLGMFSPTQKAIDMLPQEKGTGEQMLSQLGQIGGKGVKEEMLFTGIEDAFATAPKITKQELQNYISNNKTRINEIIKSEEKAKQAGQITYFKEFRPLALDFGDRGTRNFLNILDSFSSGDEQSLKLINEVSNDPNRTGTIDNPFISKIDQDELSLNFYSAIDRKYYNMVNELDDVGPNFRDKGDMYNKVRDTNLKNLIKVRFIDEDKTAYTIRGNSNVGYEVSTSKNLDKDHVDEIGIARADSYNEALLQLNDYRRQNLQNAKKDKDTIDLRPMHENYTLPGGTNYQELLLKLEEPIDNVASIAGKFDDVIGTTDNYFFVKMNAVTGSPSEASFPKEMIKTLKNGEPFKIDDRNKIRYNKDTDEIEVLKQDYINTSHTGDEKNVVVFARTKDRVDEEGRKILYAEEIQSDMSQQGRKKGLVMGQNEKKAFINKNNSIIYGDILDSINKLKNTTNIDELKAVRKARIDPRDIQIRQTPPAKQIIGFDNDTAIANVININRDFKDAHTFENIVKKHQTKYKFNELKDQNTKKLTNQGFNKTNINEINKDILEDGGITVPKGLYSDVSDYVDMSLFKNRIEAFKKVTAEKIYNREFNKTFGPLDDAGDPINRIEPKKLIEFNNNILKKILGTENHKKFMDNTVKEQTKESLELFTSMNPTKYNKLKNDEKMDMTLSDIGALDIDTDTFRKFRQNGITKSEFEEFVIAPRIQSELSSKLVRNTQPLDREKIVAENFDYSDNAIDEVYEGLIELDNNLDKAVKYDVKLRPVSGLPSAPFIGTSERFTELGIKRLLKYAKDNDYDGVSFSTGIIHDKRWNQPNLTQYYDVVIPKVAKNILKGTDAKLEYKTIFTDAKFKKQVDDGTLSLEPEMYDINKILDENLGEPQGGGFIKDTPTIYLTPDIKEYIDSGISLYSPIVATGLAGAITSQILGPEEDIIENEVANVSES